MQFSVVLRHIKRFRPDWLVDVRMGRGKHTAVKGLCHRSWHDQEPDPPGPYDTVLDLGFFENYNRYPDRPNSKVTNCLAEVFGLPWVAELGRYLIDVSESAYARAAAWLTAQGCTRNDAGRFNAVCLHYEGNTSAWKKNLAHWQASAIVETIKRAGRVPVVLDWDARTPLISDPVVRNPGCGQGDIWGSFGSGDAETLCALVWLCEAFIGIDSGPGKVASATQTPALICWRGHHPIQFHDPAENTTHLVPADHRKVPPAGDDPRIALFFEANYNWLGYEGEHGLVAAAQRWLATTLGRPEAFEGSGVSFVVPNGIGDVLWALTKIRHIAAGRPIDLVLSGDPRHEVDQRALPFVKRFGFVRGAKVMDVPVLVDRDRPTNSRGRYVYESDGPRGAFHYLVPNATLEAGRRLEEWLPDCPVDWDVFREFDWQGTDLGRDVGRSCRPFVAFYLGPELGNTDEGHNRNWLWEPRHWIELAGMLRERDQNIVLVGAPYDRSFWERYCKKGFEEAEVPVLDLIGKMEIGNTLALLKESSCLISYQCGLVMCLHYLGGRCVTWWRPEGDSCHPHHHVSFDERMKDAWVDPAKVENYFGCVYKRESVEDIIREIDRRGWLT